PTACRPRSPRGRSRGGSRPRRPGAAPAVLPPAASCEVSGSWSGSVGFGSSAMVVLRVPGGSGVVGGPRARAGRCSPWTLGTGHGALDARDGPSWDARRRDDTLRATGVGRLVRDGRAGLVAADAAPT